MTASRHRVLLVATVVVALAAALAASTGCDVADPYTLTAAEPTDTPSPFPTAEAIPRASKVSRPVGGAYHGAYLPPAPFQLDRIAQYEEETGKRLSIVMWFQPWETANRSRVDTAAIVAVMRRGKVPMITWEPWDPGNNARFVTDPGEQPDYTLSRIIDGEFDAYITAWADGLRGIGGPVMLRPMHEMNGVWYPWSGTTNGNAPEEFVAAWRHVHDIFTKQGANNVTWVWSINHESVPQSKDNGYAAYYPGDAYVDWTAISGFNRGDSADDPLWTDFEPMYEEPLAYLTTLGKPICIAEIATLGSPRERAEWIARTYSDIQRHTEIDAVIYFDSEEQTTEPQDWRVGSSKRVLEAFSAAVRDEYYVGRPPTELKSWADGLKVPQWRYLTAYDPLY